MSAGANEREVVERLDPFTTADAGNRAFHLERYAWAATHVSGGDVLDVACGVGYGSAILARAGQNVRVLGVDRSGEAIEHATERHGAPAVRFRRIEDAEAFETEERFDTIVSLETVEHLPRPLAFLRRMHALLRPGGRLIVSTPVRESPGDNPFHLHCFTAHSFRALVAEGFAIEAELDQVGAYLTIVARRRERPSAAWEDPRRLAPAPRATIALVTWNSLERVVDLVAAIRAYTQPPYDLLIVDNNSTDGTRSFLRILASEPGVRVVENVENRKCAAATNQAIELCRTEFLIYLCAPHALVTAPGWDEDLLRFMADHPDIGLAGDVWNPGFPVVSRHYRAGWTPEAHGLEKLAHVQGAAFIARRALFSEVGPFDAEAFPTGGMDVEFSYRLLSFGKKLGRAPSVASPNEAVPREEAGVSVYHPTSRELRERVREQIGFAPCVPAPPLPVGAAPPFTDWRRTRGDVRWFEDGAFKVTADGPGSGLISRVAYRDVRVEGRVVLYGTAILKLRTSSRDDPDADGYRVVLGLGPGGTYVQRGELVLTRLAPAPQDCHFTIELRGSELRLAIVDRPTVTVCIPSVSEGPILVGAESGVALYRELRVTPLGPVRSLESRPAALVFCEWLRNEPFCLSVIRELEAYYEVRAFGPGWPETDLAQVDATGARFYLELDAASGNFPRPSGLAGLAIPKFAWLVDTHKKPLFHAAISREMDLTFFAMKSWGHVLEGRTRWLPLHCDTGIFHPIEAQRDIDIAFVGSQTWRADSIIAIGNRHGLRVHVVSTPGPREKSETAAIYARSKLVFNRHVTNDLNFRVFEAMACGRVLLTDAQANGQYELFEDGRHYVLYKDERDLEAQVLRQLRDGAARERIEREAATHLAAHHSTRARVRQLREAIEAFLATRAAAPVGRVEVEPALATPDVPDAARPERRRWLIFAEEAPPSIEQRSYAERLGWTLAAHGERVVIARARRCALPPRPPRRGEPTIVELDTGPLPRAATETNRWLAQAGALHTALARVPMEGRSVRRPPRRGRARCARRGAPREATRGAVPARPPEL
jgi:SAM-dependent methyltransferase